MDGIQPLAPRGARAHLRVAALSLRSRGRRNPVSALGRPQTPLFIIKNTHFYHIFIIKNKHLYHVFIIKNTHFHNASRTCLSLKKCHPA